MTIQADLLAAALSYRAAGLSLVPVSHKTKLPAFPLLPQNEEGKAAWIPYQKSIVDEATLRHWLDRGIQSIAVVGGAVSGGLLIIDFDVARFYAAWREAVGELADGLPVQRTGGGGYQVFLLCPDPGPNDRLAWMPDEDEESGRRIAIETRGEGGYALVPPSLHPSGNRYEMIAGDLTAIPLISQARAEALLQAARKLDEAPKTRQQRESEARESEKHRRGAEKGQGAGVIEAYNRAFPIKQVLEAHAYTRKGSRYVRPGGEGPSVTVKAGRSFHHSTNDPLCDGYWHTPFDLFARYQHNDDTRAAVKAAAEILGLGGTIPPGRANESGTAMGAGAEPEDEADLGLSGILAELKKLCPVQVETAPEGEPQRKEPAVAGEEIGEESGKSPGAPPLKGSPSPDLSPSGQAREQVRAVQARALEMVSEAARLSKADLIQLATWLRDLGVTRDWVRDWQSAVNEAKKKAREATRWRASSIVNEGDATNRPNSWPYTTEGGRILYLSERAGPEGEVMIQPCIVADFEARIVEEALGEEGTRWFLLEGKTVLGQRFRLEIPAGDFADDRLLLAAITQATGARTPVRAGQTRHLRPAIQLLTDSTLRYVRRYTRTGWTDACPGVTKSGGRFLIPGREPDGVTVHLPRKLPYRVPADSDMDLGLEVLVALLESMPLQCIAVQISSFQSTMRKDLVFQAFPRMPSGQNFSGELYHRGRDGRLRGPAGAPGRLARRAILPVHHRPDREPEILVGPGSHVSLWPGFHAG